jgi:thiol:disulfide interchange protein DsbA
VAKEEKMRMIKLLYVLLAWVTLPVFGQSQQQYILAPTIQPIKEKKVEVTEFFWYGCNHCYALDPRLEKWAQGRNDIVFKRVHAPLAPGWVSMTKVFFTLVQMDKLTELHHKIFDVIHKQNIFLDDENIFFAWLPKQDIDVERFKSIYNSFGTQVRVDQAKQLALSYRLTGVPTVVVDGKYITGERYAGKDLFKVLDQLVEKAKAERKKR